MVEAEALGGRAGELVGVERARLEQHLLGRSAGRAALLDGRLDLLPRQEAELDDHVGDEARAATAALRRGEPGPVVVTRSGTAAADRGSRLATGRR